MNLTVKFFLNQNQKSIASSLKGIRSGKSYTGEGSASTKKLEKPVWRPKGRQLNKFRGMLLTMMKTNCFILLSCLPWYSGTAIDLLDAIQQPQFIYSQMKQSTRKRKSLNFQPLQPGLVVC